MNVLITYLILPLVFAYVVTLDRRPECPVGCSELVFFPHEICHKFWQCFKNTAYQFMCPHGRHWNPVLNKCDESETAGCTGEGWRNITPECPTTKTSSTTLTTLQPEPETKPSCSDQEDGTFYPSNNFSQFWQCANGIAYHFNCPEGLHWNSALEICDWPNSAGF